MPPSGIRSTWASVVPPRSANQASKSPMPIRAPSQAATDPASRAAVVPSSRGRSGDAIAITPIR